MFSEHGINKMNEQKSMMTKEIVIVDDDSVSMFLTEEIIRDTFADLSIHKFNRGIECLDFLKSEKEDMIILLDINMPEMTGWTFIEKFKDLKLKNKIIVLTSSINEDDRMRAHDFEVEFLTKPVCPEELMQVVFN
jgi:CheY-like chemotaxis protein